MGIIACDCEVYEMCPSCAPSPEAYERAIKASNDAALRLVQPRSYTLTEIEELAKQWATENEATNDARWIVSGLLAWLKKQEVRDAVAK